MPKMLTHCSWEHLVKGLRKTSLLQGIIHETDTIHHIVFTDPSGQKTSIPEGSRLELAIGLARDIYAIGIEHRPGEFGMLAGPHPQLGEMLNHEPTSPNSVILCFHRDGTEEITHTAVIDLEGYGGFIWSEKKK